jgi:hypothetical protein
MRAERRDGERRQDETMSENDDEAIESNEEAQLMAAWREGREALRAYAADVAQEQEHAGKAQVSRESAIANAIRYGAALSVGRTIHATDDNAFHGWVKHTGLDLSQPFDDRRERSAAMQMAKIAGDGSTVTPTVTPFAGCPHSRPTNCMKWFRAQREEEAARDRAEIDKLAAEREKRAAARDRAEGRAEEEARAREEGIADDGPDPIPKWMEKAPSFERTPRPRARYRPRRKRPPTRPS